MTTKPSSSSLRMASRIGVRLTPSSSARGISIRRSPGFNMPSWIACRNVSLTTSRRGLYASKRIGCNRFVMVSPPVYMFL